MHYTAVRLILSAAFLRARSHAHTHTHTSSWLQIPC